jgi:hypothetical protein
MHKPFSLISGLLLLAIAVIQGLRASYGLDVVVDGYQVPVVASWAAAAIAALLGLMVLRESRT